MTFISSPAILFHLPGQHIYITDYQRLFILIGTTSVFTITQNWVQMQIVVFHSFAYTCCTAFFQPFCGMSAIRYKVLNDRAFPHGCYRTLVECKGNVFLGISVICGGIFALQSLIRWKKCCELELFAWKSVIVSVCPLEKCL